MAVVSSSLSLHFPPSLPATTRRNSKTCFVPSFQCPTQKHDKFIVSSVPARNLSIRAARTESNKVSLGFKPPDFQLLEPLTGRIWGLEDFEPYPALLVMFICNHCPFVIHLKKDIVKLSTFYMKKGLAVVAISSNSVVTHPQDGPEFMAEDAKTFKYPFPYLYDETQDVARDFGAVCTPEFMLFKKDGRRPFELVYHGQFDDSRPSNNKRVTGRDLSKAIDSVLSGQPVSAIQNPSSLFLRFRKCWMQYKVASGGVSLSCWASAFLGVQSVNLNISSLHLDDGNANVPTTSEQHCQFPGWNQPNLL